MTVLRSSPRRRAALILVVVVRTLAGAPSSAQERPAALHPGWWAGAGALLAGTVLLDEELRRDLPEGGTLEHVSDSLNPLGNPRYLIPALAVGYAGGRLADRSRVAAASAHVFAALMAAGVANGGLKTAVGRQRPVGGDPTSFRPFNLDNRWQSFPSGHAVVAFSVAAAVSEEAREPWVTALTYGAASLVGWSRVYEDKHWASDVVGGALSGVAASHLALHLLHRRYPDDREGARPTLVLSPAGVGVRLPTR